MENEWSDINNSFIFWTTHFCFHSTHLRLILDYFSSVCPWSWLSKVVATDTLRVWKHFKYFFSFISEILGQNVFSTFPGLFTHTLNVYKVLWNVLGTFLKSTKHFFEKCLALFDWALLSTFEHLKYDRFRKLSTFYQQNF